MRGEMLAARVRSFFTGKEAITWFGDRYPELDGRHMSSIPGLYVIGNIAGTPDIRAALNAGADVGAELAQEAPLRAAPPAADVDVLIAGAGPAGVACAAALAAEGRRDFVVIERKRALATLRAFKPDLLLYDAVTGDPDNRSAFPYGNTTAGELLAVWDEKIRALDIPIREGTGVVDVVRRGDLFHVELGNGEKLTARRVVLALGKLIQLDRIAPAEEVLDCRLVEHSIAKRDEPRTETACDVIKRAGVRMERQMHPARVARLAAWVAGVMGLYLWLYHGPLDARGRHIIPFTGGAAVPGWFLYSTLYTAIIWIFGIRAIRRWRHPLQTRKTLWLMACQTILFWAIPNFVFSRIENLATPTGGYEIGYAWPLAIKPENLRYWLDAGGWTFWMFLWNMALSFVLIPLLAMKHGKKYCSWVCGCGGLAETLGDTWRHYSPKGPANTRRERQNLFVLWLAALASLLVILNTLFPDERLLGQSSSLLERVYKSLVDTWLIAIVPVSLYPILGGKVWCRFWCPTAAYIHFFSRFWSRLRRNRPELGLPLYGIFSRKERCIACNMCTRYCEVGVDVRKFAVRGTVFDNENSSCIGCGVCISVCPTETLSFEPWPEAALEV